MNRELNEMPGVERCSAPLVFKGCHTLLWNPAHYNSEIASLRSVSCRIKDGYLSLFVCP
jgi:hypothetical protein